MGRFTVIPQNTFDALQMDAGVLLKNFDIEAAAASNGEPGFTDADIITATTGGVNPTCVPTYSDSFEDVDNAPTNVMEGKHLDSWEAKLATTALGTSPELIALSLGAADYNATTGKITPRRDVKLTDFKDLWWVGDKANGGFVAVKLINALSTAGFSIQTSKNGKGQLALEFTGHVSLAAQNVVPMEFYSIDPEEGGVEYNVTQNLTNVTSSFTGTTVEENANFTATLTAADGYTLGDVTVTMGGVDITSTAYSDGTVTISGVTGVVVITATATED